MKPSKFSGWLLGVFVVIYLMMPRWIVAATQKESKNPQKPKFQASSLWGIRRGPNAPQASAQPVLFQDLEADSESKYYEQLARQGYLKSLGASSQNATDTSTSASSSSSGETCPLKKN